MANTLEIVIKATDKASKEIGAVAKGVHGLGGVASAAMKGIAVAGAAAVTAVGAVGAAIGKLAVDAIPLQGIEAAFEGISGASDEMLDALRRGSLGMVTDRELMRNYNQAAQLVSKTFADQLPDAMKYLAKVSAATGQDMGFMLDSLTKGVGRMSPMILDNLGIQVSLEEATAEAAEMFGKEADALSKTELQAGMMNVVMRALERNTEAMPEIAGTAAQRWAALGVTFKNVKDQIGLAMLPALEGMMTGVEGLVTRYLPPLVDWFERLGDKLGPAAEAFGRFITEISSEGYDKVESFKDLLWALLPTDLAKGAVGAVEWVQSLVDAIDQGDWETAGGMIWEQIVIGMGKVKVSADAFSDMMRKTFAGGLGLQEYVWDEFGNLTKGDTSWNAIGDEIMRRIAQGMVDASDWLVAFTSDATVVAKMNEAGRSIGGSIGAGLASFFGLRGSPEEAETGNAITGMMARVRDNIAELLRNIGREMGLQIAAGIAEGITGKAPEDAVRDAIETTIENAEPEPSFWQQLGQKYGKWYATLPDWFTGGTGWLEGSPVGTTTGGVIGGRASGGYASGLTLVGERGPEIVSLPRGSYVHDNRESERMMGGTSVTFGPGAIVIQGNATARDVEIGVLRGLRAAGVGV